MPRASINARTFLIRPCAFPDRAVALATRRYRVMASLHHDYGTSSFGNLPPSMSCPAALTPQPPLPYEGRGGGPHPRPLSPRRGEG